MGALSRCFTVAPCLSDPVLKDCGLGFQESLQMGLEALEIFQEAETWGQWISELRNIKRAIQTQLGYQHDPKSHLAEKSCPHPIVFACLQLFVALC